MAFHQHYAQQSEQFHYHQQQPQPQFQQQYQQQSFHRMPLQQIQGQHFNAQPQLMCDTLQRCMDKLSLVKTPPQLMMQVELMADYQSALERINKAHLDVESLQAQNKNLELRLMHTGQKLEETVREKTDVSEFMQSENNELRRRVQALEQSLNEERQSKQCELQQKQKFDDELREQLHVEKEQKMSLQEEAHRLAIDLEQSRNDMRVLEQTLNERDQEKRTMQQQLAERSVIDKRWENECEVMRTGQMLLEQERSMLQDEVASLKTDLEKVQQLAKTTAKKHHETQAQLRQSQQQLSDAQEELQTARRQQQKALSLSSNNSWLMQNSDGGSAFLRDASNEQSVSSRQMKLDLDIAYEQLLSVKKLAAQLESQVESKDAHISKLREQLSLVKSEYARLVNNACKHCGRDHEGRPCEVEELYRESEKVITELENERQLRARLEQELLSVRSFESTFDNGTGLPEPASVVSRIQQLVRENGTLKSTCDERERQLQQFKRLGDEKIARSNSMLQDIVERLRTAVSFLRSSSDILARPDAGFDDVQRCLSQQKQFVTDTIEFLEHE